VNCSCGLNLLRPTEMFYIIMFFISLARFQVLMMMTVIITFFCDVSARNFLVITTVNNRICTTSARWEYLFIRNVQILLQCCTLWLHEWCLSPDCEYYISMQVQLKYSWLLQQCRVIIKECRVACKLMQTDFSCLQVQENVKWVIVESRVKKWHFRSLGPCVITQIILVLKLIRIAS